MATNSVLSATLSRFLYGIPFAGAGVLLLHALPATASPVPQFHAGYFGWLVLGALGQLAATAFLLAAMKEKGLSPSPMEKKARLIRRVTLDLTGLPPKPEDVDQFLADTRPGAYERLVDRLMASPSYGERPAPSACAR